MEKSKPIYGVSPLIAIAKTIENIKLSLCGKRLLNKKQPPVSYDDYKNHPEVKAAVNEIFNKINKSCQ